MISLIHGKVAQNNGVVLVVMTMGGVGYKLAVRPGMADNYQIGQEISLLTYLSVGENKMDLYGFENEKERSLFLNFINVSGIGPKSALHLLSLGTVEEISNAISAGDVDYLTKVSGVGRKTAERIVVELKSKMGEVGATQSIGLNENLADVIAGLESLGYTAQQAREAIKKLNVIGKNSEQLMREALLIISKN